jgi:iron complex transport system ATP-binding protein
VSTDSSSPQLRAIDLACGYERTRRTVLSGVDLEMRRGRFICIIGPNGAGKTTLLRTLAGLLPPVTGRVLLAGSPIEHMQTLERARRLSIVLTHLDSPGYLTVGRFVELGRHPYTGLLARLSSSDHAAVGDALDQTGITHLRHRWMAEISDGERQRTAVARALAQAADVMILDEPTAFLDVAARASIMSTLRRIAHTTNRLIVTTSHDVELVLRIADVLIIVAADGSIQLGSPEDLVLSGALQSLFPDPALRFDPASGSFRLPHPTGAPVRLAGSGLAAQWTAHAIERIGRPVVAVDADAPAAGERDRPARDSPRGGSAEQTPLVRIVADATNLTWELETNGASVRCATIEALAESLRE